MSTESRQTPSSARAFAKRSETGANAGRESRATNSTTPDTADLTATAHSRAPGGAPISPATVEPASLSQRNVIQLQRLVGNRAMAQILQRQPQAASATQRLPAQLDGAMGTLFGGTSAGVNVHTDARADQAAREANTDAVAVGDDILFREGSYRPGTSDGNAVIAREVAHIQRGKLTGSKSSAPSTEASSAEKEDAAEVGEIVREMGADPARALQPRRIQPGATQPQIIQRDPKNQGKRVAGIVTSKVLQGIFTTVLGPIGLVWRGPLIQKNLAEITGWEQFGTRTSKVDKGQVVERQRYGNTGLGTAMRWMAGISELMKEFTIWLGFGTFIAAIVAAATHGAFAPVTAGLAIATAVVAGVHAVLRGLLVALNGYRLWAAYKRGDEKDKAKIPFIKHQMVSDGLEGIGAAIAAVLSGMTGGGLGSLGGDLAKDAGVATTSQPLAAVGLGTATGLPTSIGLAGMKEGGKDIVKPSAEKSFKEGFLKDSGDINTAYSKESRKKFGFRKKPSPAPTDQQPDLKVATDAQPPVVQQVLAETADISDRSKGANKQQLVESSASREKKDVMSSAGSMAGDVGGKTSQATSSLRTTADQAKDLDVDGATDKAIGGNPDQAKRLSQEIKQGLKTPDPTGASSPSGDEAVIADIDQEDAQINQGPADSKKPELVEVGRTIQRKGGWAGRTAEWLASKLGGIKAGLRRLNGKIIAGVLKYAAKFDKSEEERNTAIAAMAEEKTFADKDSQEEAANDTLFADFQGKADQLKSSVTALSEKDK